MARLGFVIIGRNEGDRLLKCLTSVAAARRSVVYVDSGSSDGSVGAALSVGAEVVQLDTWRSFSAARARNLGLSHLQVRHSDLAFVQFIDGDCEMDSDWIERGLNELASDRQLAAVCGQLRERFPSASIYNRLCELEWDRPAGEITACGGVAMYRVSALREVSGFDETVVAGEEPELCLRLRRKGWKIRRIDAEMALHDAAMMHFSQWWRRAVRGGYGGLDVATRFERGKGSFSRQVRSARIWGVGWPITVLAAAALASLVYGPLAAILLGLAAFSALPAQVIRLSWRTVRRGTDLRTSVAYGVLTMLGKWAHLQGQYRCWRDRRAGRGLGIIEHKIPANAPIAVNQV